MLWRFPCMLQLPRGGGVFSQRVFLAGSLLLVLPLAVLGVLPTSAFAHPARSAAPSTGSTASLAMDLTLHYRSTLSGIYQPDNLATDAQGNLYVSEYGPDLVRMYGPNDVFVRAFGTGSLDTAEGVAASDTTVFVVDSVNHQIQAFNKNTGSFLSEFGAADLANPDGLALGANGTLYVVDRDQNRIAEFSTDGSYLGSFGTAGSGNGQFNLPSHIAASRFGALYVTDAANNRVQEFTLDGSYITQWGHASFKAPLGLAVDRAGMVYVADETARTIYKFDPGGSLVGSYTTPITAPLVPGDFVEPSEVAVRSIPNTPLAVYVADESVGVERFDQVLNPQLHTYQAQWGGTGSGDGQFNLPVAAVVDSAGNVYVTDYNNNRVEKFDQFGTFVLVFGGLGNGNGQLFEPTGMTISADGSTIFVVDQGNSRIEEFSPSGGYLGQFGQSGSGEGQLHLSQGIAIDGIYLFVADAGNNRIEVFNTSGVYQWQFGSAGSGPTQFNFPRGVAVDINRNELFIADSGNNRVEVYTTGGQELSAITTAGGVNLNDPFGVSTDPRGDVYVADSLNNRIVETDVTTTHTTAFGAAGTGNGQFNYPTSVTVSPTNGQLYVLDWGSNRVERFGSPWPKHDTVGVYRPSTKTFYLRNENTTGPADISVYMPYAQTGDIPIVGDWNGHGVDTVGLYRPSKARFLLQDANVQESTPDYVFTLGIAGDTPLAGELERARQRWAGYLPALQWHSLPQEHALHWPCRRDHGAGCAGGCGHRGGLERRRAG